MQSSLTARFRQVAKRLHIAEGELSVDPEDRGNWTSGRAYEGQLLGTKFGISAAAFPTVDIRSLTQEQALQLAKSRYWDVLRCDELGIPLDEFVFDFGFNSGPATAARALQGAVGVLRDGVIGPVTLAAVKRADPLKVLRLMFVERAMLFARDPTIEHHGRGWYARLFDQTALAMKELRS